MKIFGIILSTVIILIGCQGTPAIDAQATDTQNALVTEIEDYIQNLAVQDAFSGNILIAKDDKVILKKAYGLAHQGHNVANNTDTKFYLASIGKSFTAVSIFQLMQAGELKLDDPLGKFLPDYPNEKALSITIAQLLSHRSGLANYFRTADFLEASKDRFRSLSDLASLYEKLPLESDPGDFSYRNTNYNILGRIIEVITKQSYDDYLQQHIFDPLQMRNTGNYDIDHPIANAAEGYMLSEVYPGRYQKNVHRGAVKGGPAGGGFSTLDDLFKFARGIHKHQLLSPQTTRLFITPPRPDWNYGYGMQFANPDKGTVYGHSGGFPGVGSEWRYFSDEGYTVVILTNRDQSQGFLAVRYFIQSRMGYSNPRIDQYQLTNQVIKTIKKDGFDEALSLASERKDELSEREITVAGYDLLKRGHYDIAISAFTIQTLLFPKSSDAFDSLGEAYLKSGNKSQAIINYKQSVVLNPDNARGAEILKDIISSLCPNNHHKSECSS